MRFETIGLAAAGLSSILFFAACTRDQKPPPKDERSALQRLREDYCDFAGQMVCARKDRCPEEVLWWWREAPDCVAAVREHCLAQPFVGDFNNYSDARGEAWAQYLRFDAGTRDACLVQARETACGEFDFDCLDDDSPIVGTSGRGGGCYYRDHCANPDDDCADDPSVCGGTCQAAIVEGAPCPGSTACVKGTYCASDRVCRQPPGANEPCPDYRCAQGATCFDGTCMPLAQENETCSYQDGPVCGRGLYCHSPNLFSPGTCRPKLGEGESCTSFSDCRRGLTCHDSRCQKPVLHGGACDAGNFCERDTRCTGGKCVGDARLGEACEAEGRECVGHLPCIRDPNAVAGTCAYSPIPDGKACENDDFCVARDRICASATPGGESVCRLKGAAGSPCGSEWDCEDVFFCDDTARTCAARLPADADCSADAESCGKGFFCRSSDSTCQPAPGDGEACAPNGGCGGDLFCNGVTCQRRAGAGEPCGEGEGGGYTSCANGLECDQGRTCADCPF